MMDPWKAAADGLVALAGAKLIFTPIAAVLVGELYGPEALVCGALVIGAIMFVEFYFRDEGLDNS